MIKYLKIVQFFLVISCYCHSYEYEIAICTVFQNESPYLKEWIEYHRIIGVEHFYLYNHYGTDNFAEVLAPYVEEGVVELFDWMETPTCQEEFAKLQVRVFKDAARKAEHCCKWLAFIDTDEFIFPVEDYYLPDFLRKYEDFGALTINWQIFGTSNIQNLDPNELMIKQLIYRAQRKSISNVWIKMIVQLKYINWSDSLLNVFGCSGWSPHRIPTMQNRPAVNSNFRIVNGLIDKTIPVDKIRLNHYRFRDEEYFRKTKLDRVDITKIKKEKLLKEFSISNSVLDTDILRYGNELREAVFSDV